MKTKTNLRFTMASATPADDATFLKQAVTTIRTQAEGFQTCIAGLADYLEEPLKSKFIEVKSEINKMLAGLPDTDKIPAASASNDILRNLLGVLSTAQMMISSLSETAKNANSSLQSARASMTGEVEKAIAAKITSGELVKKEDVQTKITDATSAAVKQAQDNFAALQKLVADRKAQLTTAGLKAPADDILAKKDEEFTPLKTQAEKRATELKAFGLPEDRLIALCWNPDQAAYDDAVSLMNAVQKGGGKPGGNGFANHTPAAEAKDARKAGLF